MAIQMRDRPPVFGSRLYAILVLPKHWRSRSAPIGQRSPRTLPHNKNSRHPVGRIIGIHHTD